MTAVALPRAVAEHQRRQRRRTLGAVAEARRAWAGMGDNLDASWRLVAPKLVQAVATVQLEAARDGSTYVGQALRDQGLPDVTDGLVRPGAFAGVASSLDGTVYGSLEPMLYSAVVRARTVSAPTLGQRLLAGRRRLDVLVWTQVGDAGRMAAATTITATPGAGWIRAVTPPCCQRCAALAGKFFHSNQGFARHPRCDCRHIPTSAARANKVGVVIGPEDVRDLTQDQRRAIDDGADMNRVINSHRAGRRSDDGMTTRELAPRRGQRLTPEGIYRVSATREESLRRLRENGYLL